MFFVHNLDFGGLGFRLVDESYCSLYYLNDLCYFWVFGHRRFKMNARTPSWLVEVVSSCGQHFCGFGLKPQIYNLVSFYHLIEPDFQSVVVAAAKNVPSCIVCALCLFTYGKYIYIFVKGLNFSSDENLVVPLIRFSVFVWEYCVLHLGLLGLTGPTQETGYDLPCSLMRNIRTLIIFLQMDL